MSHSWVDKIDFIKKRKKVRLRHLIVISRPDTPLFEYVRP